MEQQKLGGERKYIRVSSSIANWRKKLEKRTGLPHWKGERGHVIFFGMYHIGDFLRVLYHRGPKTIFWGGSDILQAHKSLWGRVIKHLHIRHVCENKVERYVLENMGIHAEIHPMIFDPIIPKNPRYTASPFPEVFLCAHKGAEKEYGLDIVEKIASSVPVTFHIYGLKGVSRWKNVIYHGDVPTEQFDREIQKYHAGLRLNKFDGFSEVLAKSVLLGQYPISAIPYQYIDHYKSESDLINLLWKLQKKTKPNLIARHWWDFRLKRSLDETLKTPRS